MKAKVVAHNRGNLDFLIENEIELNGYQCDLNHIDISNVMNLNCLFHSSDFNGNISDWDTSKVTHMVAMFQNSLFNGDISNWDVSNVNNMRVLFSCSDFNGDISQWDVSNVKDMSSMFLDSEFSGALSNWKPFEFKILLNMFKGSHAPIPYWYEYDDLEKRKKVINSYHFHQELNQELTENNSSVKKIKI